MGIYHIKEYLYSYKICFLIPSPSPVPSSIGRYFCCSKKVTFENICNILLLYEYRDLFIDMDVRNNRSRLAIANRLQER